MEFVCGRQRSAWQLGTTQKEKCELPLVGIKMCKSVSTCGASEVYEMKCVCSVSSCVCKIQVLVKFVFDKSAASK